MFNSPEKQLSIHDSFVIQQLNRWAHIVWLYCSRVKSQLRYNMSPFTPAVGGNGSDAVLTLTDFTLTWNPGTCCCSPVTLQLQREGCVCMCVWEGVCLYGWGGLFWHSEFNDPLQLSPRRASTTTITQKGRVTHNKTDNPWHIQRRKDSEGKIKIEREGWLGGWVESNARLHSLTQMCKSNISSRSSPVACHSSHPRLH